MQLNLVKLICLFAAFLYNIKVKNAFYSKSYLIKKENCPYHYRYC